MATVPNREFERGKTTQKENQTRHLKGLSVGNGKGREGRNQKRTVLGSITNVRVQPSRAAKVDGRQDENAGIPQKVFCGQPRNQPFSIYVDEDAPFPQLQAESKVVDHDDGIENQEPSLDEAVACLPVIPPSLSMGGADDPCYLDMSGIEENVVEIQDVDDEDADEDSEEESVSMNALEPPMTKEERDAYIEEVPEYAADIYSYLLSVEPKNYPRPGFMKRQEDVTVAMRSILVDWLVEVAEEYKLQRETLFLTVSYIDRFLAQMSVLRSKLQLVGAAAMFLAAKYEEIYPPDVNEFVYITDDTYQKKQILRMEHLILKVLKFDLATPTINWFSERLLRKTRADDTQSNLTMYICELVLVDYEKFLVFPASLVAAGALCVANYTLGHQEFWSSNCEELSCYSLSQLMPCVQMMYDLHSRIDMHPQQSVREKYRLPKYSSVADLAPQPLLFML